MLLVGANIALGLEHQHPDVDVRNLVLIGLLGTLVLSIFASWRQKQKAQA